MSNGKGQRDFSQRVLSPDIEVALGKLPRSERPASFVSAQAQWAPPYRAIFTTPHFEMGENSKSGERKFFFFEKPSVTVTDELEKNGFRFNAADNAWTISTSSATRKLSDDLARQFASESQIFTR